ncbi:hypothetical protein Hdeb2414_s0011g00363141 [Helianthus debilis subsp. tardiflorus]
MMFFNGSDCSTFGNLIKLRRFKDSVHVICNGMCVFSLFFNNYHLNHRTFSHELSDGKKYMALLSIASVE